MSQVSIRLTKHARDIVYKRACKLVVYDKNGYDKDGYDKDGYDKDGYDDTGYGKDGYPRIFDQAEIDCYWID